MLKYYVYDAKTGDIVHIHESYDSISGESLPCSPEDVFAVVDEALQTKKLEILEVEVGRQDVGRGVVRVNPKTRELVVEQAAASDTSE